MDISFVQILILLVGYFFFGASLGSFVGLVAVRTSSDRPKNLSLTEKSKCDNCNSELQVVDLIPVFSALFLKFKCRVCSKPIDKSYFVVELITGALFVLNGIMFHTGNLLLPQFIFNFFVISLFVYLSYFDFKYYLVQVNLVIAGIILLLIGYVIYSQIFNTPLYLVDNLFGGIVGALYVTILILISRGRGMGLGDLWVMVLIGLLVGLKGVIGVIFVSIFFGALLGIIKAIFIDKKFKGVIIPYVPFLTLGLFIELFFAEQVFKFLFPLL